MDTNGDAIRMVMLYDWSRFDEVMDTQYGRITVEEWLRREKDRIESDSSRKAVIQKSGYLISLIVDKPSDLL